MDATLAGTGLRGIVGSPRRRPDAHGLAAAGGPLFTCGWERVAFFHYEVDPRALQACTPFALDLREGRAYVSLVAFTLTGMRLARGGRLGAWICRPVATHPFLNVRTYVVERGEPGIQFLAEWLPSAPARLLGPPLFGLPYRRGRIDAREDVAARTLFGSAEALDARARLEWRGSLDPDVRFEPATPGSLDEFLLERYVAFTVRRRVRRLFRVGHPPWRVARVSARVQDRGVLAAAGPWAASARFVGAHYAHGFPPPLVGMGPPVRLGADFSG